VGVRVRQRWRARFALAALLLVGCQGIDPTPGDEPMSAADRARFVAQRVGDAQAFRVQKRFTAAEHQLRQALSVDPEHARAHSLLARTLHDLGRDDEAAPHAARAQALAPAPSPPAELPLVTDASGLLFVLLPPESEGRETSALPGEWEDPRLPGVLAKRIRLRLPKAEVKEVMPTSLLQAEAWLRTGAPRAVVSLRVDQALCSESAKDGPFAMVKLTVVSALSGALPDEPARIRATDDDPALAPECVDAALLRALEQTLALPGVLAAVAAPLRPAKEGWPALAVRALFPLVALEKGREIARGRVEADAQRGPQDATSEIALAEQDRARERDAVRAPTPTDAEEAALEAEVEGERRRRDELLAALRVDELAQRAPTADEIAVLRVIALGEPASLGAQLARTRAGGRTVEARELHGPDGTVLARFYFEPGASAPLLREEDSQLDGTPDRWTAYANGRPSEVFEDRGASGHVNAHIRLAPDGVSTETIEIDLDGDGHAERVFHYTAGILVAGDEDADGDGRLDRFERFEPDGALIARDEDLDGDGSVDVHSEFQRGKLLRREIRNPALVESLSGRPAPRP
jgi:hypothetical protein